MARGACVARAPLGRARAARSDDLADRPLGLGQVDDRRRRSRSACVGAGRFAYVLDGDNLRHGLNRDLGFDDRSRTENVRRAGEVARLLADAGAVVLVGLISPIAADRELVRRMHAESDLEFLEVHVDTSLQACERRDPKGLYAKARRGEIPASPG